MKTIITTDIHGCALELTALLRKAELDRTKDRLVILGDLFDRGRHSYAVYRTVRKLAADPQLLSSGASTADSGPSPPLNCTISRWRRWAGFFRGHRSGLRRTGLSRFTRALCQRSLRIMTRISCSGTGR